MKTPVRNFALALSALSVVAASANAQAVNSNIGTVSSVVSIEDNVRSNQMGGMRVTARFENGSSFSGFWGDLGGGSWGVALGDRWARVSMPGANDTFGNDWTINLFRNTNLTGLRFEGGQGYGGVMFDRSRGFLGSVGTPGSNIGGDFNLSALWQNVTATYSNAVGLGVAAPVGDLFTQVDVDFSNARTCFFILCDGDVPDDGNNGMTFTMDTDLGRFGSPNTVVPEPSTYALMAAGLAALGVAARRRNRSALSVSVRLL